MKITSDNSITRAGGSSSSASAIPASKTGAVLKSISPPMLTTATPSRCATDVVIGSAADNGHPSSAVLSLVADLVPTLAALANSQKYYFNGRHREARLV